MEPDLDDTVRARPRPPAERPPVDLDDTVARAPAPAEAPIDAAPVEAVPVQAVPADPVPALVEPPAPAPRTSPVELPALALDPPSARPARTPRPPRLRLPDGGEVPLDAPVYVGRRPHPPRIRTGPEPRLVTVPSPGKEISATHVELRSVGGSLVVADLRSTNGTIVLLPLAPPRTLIRGESAVVVPGTRIDLGEGVVLEILPPELEAAS